MLAGSFLAFLAIEHLVPPEKAAEPTQMYLVAFQYVFSSPQLALAFTGAFVIVSQIKINVTNAYAGSHRLVELLLAPDPQPSGPRRVAGVQCRDRAAADGARHLHVLEHILGLYSIFAVAWVGALVADLVDQQAAGPEPAGIEFKRAHLYDINPVGVGAMLLATVAGIVAFFGRASGRTLQSLSRVRRARSSPSSWRPLIACVTKGRFYLARAPRQDWSGQTIVRCAICEHPFETEDMAHCPAYSGPICSLCCTLEARCHDCCKPQARISTQIAQPCSTGCCRTGSSGRSTPTSGAISACCCCSAA